MAGFAVLASALIGLSIPNLASLSDNPDFTVTPRRLVFSAPSGSAAVAPQQLRIANGGDRMLRWRAENDVDWIELGADHGSLSAGRSTQLQVMARIEGLNLGHYDGSIAFVDAEHPSDAHHVPVTLVVGSLGPLVVEPQQLEFRAQADTTTGMDKTVRLTNIGTGLLEWEASSSIDWLTLGAHRGTLSPGQSVEMAVFAQSKGLEAGSYEACVNFSTSSVETHVCAVTVRLIITEPPPLLAVTPQRLEFHADKGEGSPPKQSLTLRNAQGQVINWTATAYAVWIELSPLQGTLRAGEQQTIDVSVQPTDLDLGTHQTELTISAPTAQNSPQVVAITLELTGVRPVVSLDGHVGAVYEVDFSPDDHLLVSGSADNLIKVWDLDGYHERYALAGRGGGVRTVAFSPTGEIIASGAGDGTIALWDVRAGKLERLILASGGFGGVDHSIEQLEFSPNGLMIASVSWGGGAKLWDVSSGQMIRDLSSGPFTLSIAYSPDGQLVASNHANDIMVWEATSGRLVERVETGSRIESVSFAPSGRLLAAGSINGEVSIVDLETGQLSHLFQEHTGAVRGIAYHPEGKLLATASTDGTIRLWQTDNQQAYRTFFGDGARVNSVSFSSTGDQLAAAYSDGSIRIWDIPR